MNQSQFTTEAQTNHQIGENVEKYPKEIQNLEHISLRQLKLRNKQTQNAIQAVQARINFMKTKEEKTVKKVLNVKRKLNSLQGVKVKAKQLKQMSMEQIAVLSQVQRQNLRQENSQKANRVRIDHIDAHEKRKLYFLDKLEQFKHIKQQKLRQQLRERQRQEMMINELQEKQRALLQRLSISQKFRLKCQQEYEDAKRKYHSFYEASRGISRDISRSNSNEANRDDKKADIFIS